MDEQKLDEIYTLTKDNNRMLRAMRRDAFVGGVVKFIIWVIMFVVLPYIAWLFIQPYLQGAVDSYQKVQKTADAVNASAGANASQLQELFKVFQGEKAQ